jgi:hypothetical protein
VAQSPPNERPDPGAGTDSGVILSVSGLSSRKLEFRTSALDAEKLARFAKRNPTPEQWASLLVVHAVPDSGAVSSDQPPVAGTYRVEGNTLRLTPKYPAASGVTYEAWLDGSVLEGPGRSAEKLNAPRARISVRITDPDRVPTTSVKTITPSQEVLPENLLKFYIDFSAPMSRGESYRHIQLLDSAGKPVPDPFLELDEELWSPDGKRLTLLFDPGRIKRGLKPREEVGPILEQGKSYTLVIDRRWPDARGNPLAVDFRKPFRVGPPDLTPPDPHSWTVIAPKGACLAPLEVRFPEPLDSALAQRLITVRDAEGHPVRGEVIVDQQEYRWRMTPESSWKPGGEYRLVIGTELEDLAGNSIGRPFEVDMAGPISGRVTSETVTLPFRVGPAAR